MKKKVMTSKEKQQGMFGCLIIVVLLGWFGYWAYDKYVATPKKEQKELETFVATDLKSKMDEFISDSSKADKQSAIEDALMLIDNHPETKEATICRQWFDNNKIDFQAAKNKRQKFIDSFSTATKEKVMNDIEQNGTQPKDDELHDKAFIIAKDFVKAKLKAPSSADFNDDYYWGSVFNDTYIIRSTVDAQNSFGAKLRNKWSVKLRFKGGEWTEASNWELINISLTE